MSTMSSARKSNGGLLRPTRPVLSRSARMAALALVLCVTLITPAEAVRRWPVILDFNDILLPVGAFPADYGINAALKAGYRCSHFGLFWANVWTWDCFPVAIVDEHSYQSLPGPLYEQVKADPRLDLDHAEWGLWQRWGFWGTLSALGASLLLLVLAALLGALPDGARGRPHN